MAMPSMSRPTGGGDMDLLKSLLKNGSSNSDEDPEAGKSKSASISSASFQDSKSSSRCSSRAESDENGRKTRCRSRSNSSGSKSPLEEKKSSSDIWEDFDPKKKEPEKPASPAPVDTAWTQKEKSDDEETQSYQYSSFSSIDSDDSDRPKSKKFGKKKRKKATKSSASKSEKDVSKKKATKKAVTKRKPKNEKKEKDQDNESLKYDSDDENKSTHKADKYKTTPGTTSFRIDLQHRRDSDASEKKEDSVTTAPEYTQMQQFYRNRTRDTKQKKQTELSEKAKHTLHLYPENLRGQHRLEKNYKELQELLQGQFLDYHDDMNKEIVSETKQALKEYKDYSHGYVGSLKPPPGTSNGSRRSRLWSAQRVPESAQTQTDDDTDGQENGRRRKARPYSAHGYYLIDTTKPEMKKHVTFVQENGFMQHTTSDDESYTRQSSKEEDAVSKPRGRVRSKPMHISAKQLPQKNHQVRQQTNAATKSTRPISGRKKDDSASDSSTSRSRSRSKSRSRSRSIENKTDHLLKETDEPKIKEWLKQKNKFIRAQRKDERRKERQKRKEEAEKIKAQTRRHEDSDKAIINWQREKQREAKLNRLLKKRPTDRDGAADLSTGDSKSEVITNETIELNSNKTVENTENVETTRNSINTDTKGEEILKCTCGYLDSSKLKEEEERQARKAMKLRMERETERKVKMGPKPPGVKRTGVNRGQISLKPTTTQRLTYDDWVKLKKTEDMEKWKQENKGQEQSLAQSDPEDEEVISSMAKKRIDKIKEGKKRIDTGLSSVDAEVNKSMDEKVQKKKKPSYKLEEGKAVEVQPASGSSARFYRWSASDKGTTGNKQKRPVSAQVETVTPRKSVPKRPASAKHSDTPDEQPSKSISSQISNDSLELKRSRSASPKPKTKKTAAYSSVKYQRRSWDEFSDYVWDKLNDDEDEILDDAGERTTAKSERPEPQGADSVPSASGDPEQPSQMTIVQGSEVIKDKDDVQKDQKNEDSSRDAKTTEDADPDLGAEKAESGIQEESSEEVNERAPEIEENQEQTPERTPPNEQDNTEEDTKKVQEQPVTSEDRSPDVADDQVFEQPEGKSDTTEDESSSPKSSARKVRFATEVVAIESEDYELNPSSDEVLEDVPPPSDYDVEPSPEETTESATSGEASAAGDVVNDNERTDVQENREIGPKVSDASKETADADSNVAPSEELHGETVKAFLTTDD